MSTMAEATGEAEKPRRDRMGLVLGSVAALALGGGGFFAIYRGYVDPLALLGETGGSHAEAAPGDVAFVPTGPIMITLPPGTAGRHLRFSAELETAPEKAAEVAALMPRVLDVLNTYLRAVEARDLEDPAALARLRAQMLRRVQVVTGEGRVRDLLVVEFVAS